MAVILVDLGRRRLRRAEAVGGGIWCRLAEIGGGDFPVMMAVADLVGEGLGEGNGEDADDRIRSDRSSDLLRSGHRWPLGLRRCTKSGGAAPEVTSTSVVDGDDDGDQSWGVDLLRSRPWDDGGGVILDRR